MRKRLIFEAGGNEEDYVAKCNTCKHSYTRKNESDALFCSLKECRYEPIIEQKIIRQSERIEREWNGRKLNQDKMIGKNNMT